MTILHPLTPIPLPIISVLSFFSIHNLNRRPSRRNALNTKRSISFPYPNHSFPVSCLPLFDVHFPVSSQFSDPFFHASQRPFFILSLFFSVPRAPISIAFFSSNFLMLRRAPALLGTCTLIALRNPDELVVSFIQIPTLNPFLVPVCNVFYYPANRLLFLIDRVSNFPPLFRIPIELGISNPGIVTRVFLVRLDFVLTSIDRLSPFSIPRDFKQNRNLAHT